MEFSHLPLPLPPRDAEHRVPTLASMIIVGARAPTMATNSHHSIVLIEGLQPKASTFNQTDPRSFG